jgi:2-dehydropantoate 2-reductase
MRIVVIGAGVLGSLYGARLAFAGQEVTVLARGARLYELQRSPIKLVDDENGTVSAVTLRAIARLEPAENYDLALVMVRADQIDDLLPQLIGNLGVKTFLFMHNRAAGSAALAGAVGLGRVLLGFPGASGQSDGETIRYRLIAEQPTTMGEPGGSLSPRLRNVAGIFENAGFSVVLNRRMDDWLKTHAVFVTAIAGAIYLADGNAPALAANRDGIRTLVRGIRQGFRALKEASVSIEPKKLALLFGLPSFFPEIYWARYLARPAADLIFARHAQSAPHEMLKLIEELRITVGSELHKREDLEVLWAAVETAACQAPSLHKSVST